MVNQELSILAFSQAAARKTPLSILFPMWEAHVCTNRKIVASLEIFITDFQIFFVFLQKEKNLNCINAF